MDRFIKVRDNDSEKILDLDTEKKYNTEEFLKFINELINNIDTISSNIECKNENKILLIEDGSINDNGFELLESKEIPFIVYRQGSRPPQFLI